MKTRGQKALLNTIVLTVHEIVSFVSALILPRFILAAFGSEYNGISSSIAQFLEVISLLIVGIGGPTRVALYKTLAEGDREGTSGIVNATESYMRKVAMALMVYIGAMFIFYPYIAETSLPHSEIRLLILLVGMSSFARYFFGITYNILLQADQKLYVYYIAMSGVVILNLISAIALIKVGMNIFVVKGVSAVINVLVPIIMSIYVRKKYEIDKKVPKNKLGLKGRWDAMWHSIANIIHTNTDLVVLTVFSNVKMVSVYTIHYLVINGVFKILSTFTNSLEAAFGNMLAKKETKAAYRHLENYEFFTALFVSVIFSCTLSLIVPFVKLYTAGITDVNYIVPTFAVVAVVAQIAMCFRQPYITIVQAAGHYKQTRNGAFLEAGINVVLSVVLTSFFGIVGVAIGTLVANLFRTLQYVFYLKDNIIKYPVSKPLLIMLWTAGNTVVITLLCNFIIGVCEISGWVSWIVLGFVCVIVSFTVTLVSAVIFYRQRMVMFKNIAMSILKKKK